MARATMARFSVVALSGTLALAHQGFGGRSNRAAPICLEGVVAEACFGFPQAELTLHVDVNLTVASAPADLRAKLGRRLELETPPVALFFALEDRICVRDRVRLVVLRNCEAPHPLGVQRGAPPTGAPVLRRGRMRTETGAADRGVGRPRQPGDPVPRPHLARPRPADTRCPYPRLRPSSGQRRGLRLACLRRGGDGRHAGRHPGDPLCGNPGLRPQAPHPGRSGARSRRASASASPEVGRALRGPRR